MKKRLFAKFTSVALPMFLVFLLPTMAFAATLVPVSTSNQSSSVSTGIDPVLLNAVNAAKFGFGGKGKSVGAQALTSAVAVVSIFADPTGGSSGYVSGHVFITVKNVSGGTIQIGKFTGIANNKTMSLGTWGNKPEHTGLWYDLESYYVYHSWYSGRVSTSYIMTSTQLASLNSYIINNDYWSYTTNCSSFAASAWNSAVDPSYSLSAGVPNTPLNLANNLKSKFPGYQTGAAVPWDYIVYYAQGTGTPIASTIYI